METRSHYYKIIFEGKEELRPKKRFPDERTALCAARRINAFGHDIHKMAAYHCRSCNGWHLGHNHTVMTNEMRDEAKKKILKEDLFR